MFSKVLGATVDGTKTIKFKLNNLRYFLFFFLFVLLGAGYLDGVSCYGDLIVFRILLGTSFLMAFSWFGAVTVPLNSTIIFNVFYVFFVNV